MTDIAEIGIRVESRQLRDANAELDKFSGASVRAERAARGFETQSNRLAGVLRGLTVIAGGVFSGAALMSGMTGAVRRLEEMESRLRKIDRALEANGYKWDLTTKKIVDYANALERRTGRAIEEVLSIAPNLASFQFTEHVALRSIALADDMAAAWGGSLQQNFEGLARALADPVKGFAMLSARGIQLDETQKKLVKSLMESGQGLKAQQVVLEALEAQVQGVAEAGFTPLARAMNEGRRATERFFERLVSFNGAGSAIIGTINTFSAAMGALADNIDLVVASVGLLAAGHIASGIAAITVRIWAMTAAMGAATIGARLLSGALAIFGGPIGFGIVALGTAAYLLTTRLNDAGRAADIHARALDRVREAAALAAGGSEDAAEAYRVEKERAIENATATLALAEAKYAEAEARRAAAQAAVEESMRSPWMALGLGEGAGLNLSIETQGASKAQNAIQAAKNDLQSLRDEINKLDTAVSGGVTDREFGTTEAAEKATKALEEYIEQIELANQVARNEADGLGYRNAYLEAEFALRKAMKRELTPDEKEQLTTALIEQETLAREASLVQQEDQLKMLELEKTLIGATEVERAVAIAQLAEEQRLRRENILATSDDGKARLENAAKIARETEEYRKQEQAVAFLKDTNRSFFTDLKSGLEQGKGIWRSFGDAVVGVLNRIADRILQMAADGLFDMVFGMASGGSSGNILGSLGSLIGFSSGGYTGDGPTGQVAGVVHGQEFVVNAAATAQHRALLEAINDNAPGYKSGGYVTPRPAPVSSHYPPREAANDRGPQTVVYIDATGADAAAIARLEAGFREMNASFERRSVAAVSGRKGRGGTIGKQL